MFPRFFYTISKKFSLLFHRKTHTRYCLSNLYGFDFWLTFNRTWWTLQRTHRQPLSPSCTMFRRKSQGATQKLFDTLFICNLRSTIKQRWKGGNWGTVWTFITRTGYPLQWSLAVNCWRQILWEISSICIQ